MDGLTLLRRTHEAGLKVAVEGDKLVIRGPKRAEPVARLLIECKLEVMAALALGTIDCPYASEVTCAAASDRRNAESADKSAHVTNPRWWRNLFAERAAHYELGGKRLRAEAERLAADRVLVLVPRRALVEILTYLERADRDRGDEQSAESLADARTGKNGRHQFGPPHITPIIVSSLQPSK
jgi:hypothetical protein